MHVVILHSFLTSVNEKNLARKLAVPDKSKSAGPGFLLSDLSD